MTTTTVNAAPPTEELYSYYMYQGRKDERVPQQETTKRRTFVAPSTKHIHDKAFIGCKLIKHIKIPDTIETIGEGA